ncbi:ATP-binding protein [Bacillus aquiflavi]|uniref:ATP-binding protein n=1 Tax=Bacillus aquiflavi TaxID=2672567 RepID=UPI00223AA9FF|nr:ATP-binding protein [Bacillus aquiflavi]
MQLIKKNKKIRFIVILSIIFLLALTAINISVSYLKTKKTVEVTIASHSEEIANTIAASIDINKYEHFMHNPVENELFFELNDYLIDIREKTGALHVYTLEIDNPKVSKIMIPGFSESSKATYIGSVCTVPEKQVRKAYYSGESYYTEVIKDPQFGDYISAGAPIKNKENKVIGFLGVDISAATLDEIGKLVIKSNLSLFIFNGIFVFILLVSFFVIQKWYQTELSKEVGETEKTYQTEFKTIINSIRSIRHDFVNHIQVMHGLLKIKSYEKAFEYVDSLKKEVAIYESVPLKVNNPALMVLLQTKWIQAQNNKVETTFKTCDDSFQDIKTIDLIKILSNLIDNALDATMEVPENERKLCVKCDRTSDHYLLRVTNTGTPIPVKSADLIFQKGYSTKHLKEGQVRGYGLYIVKEVVDKYRGTITFQSEKNRTTFEVSIPIKEIKKKAP